MHDNNGHQSGNGKGVKLSDTPPTELPTSPRPKPSLRHFDQPVILQPTNHWSRAILWTLITGTVLATIWACVAQIEQAVPAQGKLEPIGTVKEVQVPIGGVVKAVYVADGQQVKRGEKLVSLDPTTGKAQLASLKKIRASLMQENQFYQAQLQGAPQRSPQGFFAPEVVALTRSRATLLAENRLYQAELGGGAATTLSTEQRERLQSNQTELGARVSVAQLEAAQLTKQLRQTQIKLNSTNKTLRINQGILRNVEPLARQGAISQIQLLKQQQDVETNQSESNQLRQEQARLQLAISQAQVQVQGTVALSRRDLYTQMAENNKRIAQIEGELTKAIVENQKKVAEIDSQLSQAQQNLRYAEVVAPVAGTVFELKARSAGFVAQPSEPILKLVPDEGLIAQVFITNKDIGFIRPGMAVDVRIDSFPFSEFGDVKGELVWIGSDVLPPDQVQPYYRFPAKVRMKEQALAGGGRRVRLQSGMAVTANIKVRKRSVMSIFTEMFTKNTEGLRFVR